jgi:cytoskeletal protein CcmA (bactofilin family)
MSTPAHGAPDVIKLKGIGAGEDLNGFMDEGTEFLGELRFRNVLRIDGRLKGKVVSDNTLIVGESGHVEADIDCGVVSIRGTVLGRVHARQRIELLAGSRVQATLVSPKLVIEDGAYFEGECEMGGPPRSALPPRPLAGGA